jgi:uncharacterized protein (TIGR02145 family)
MITTPLSGWHVASDEEWDELEDCLRTNEEYWCDNNSEYIAKSLASKDLWELSSNICAIGNNASSNNASGFTGRPGGYRSYNNGSFSNIGDGGYWWSSSEYSYAYAKHRYLDYSYSNVIRRIDFKRYGFSVRCVKD